MNHNLTKGENRNEFLVDRENKTIVVKREFAAELPLVWKAYTNSEILDQWWAPKPWKAKTKSLDFKEGGIWLYAMVGPEGEEHWALVKYTGIQSTTLAGKRKFSGLDVFADSDGKVNKNLPQSKWEVTFTEQGEKTLVEILISYEDLAQLDATIQMGFKEGLTMAMEGLDELLPDLKER